MVVFITVQLHSSITDPSREDCMKAKTGPHQNNRSLHFGICNCDTGFSLAYISGNIFQ